MQNTKKKNSFDYDGNSTLSFAWQAFQFKLLFANYSRTYFWREKHNRQIYNSLNVIFVKVDEIFLPYQLARICDW